ncbi:ABC transporter substrate-binding protein [Lacrimispora defluvii]|uniref:ABC transporter substrate-binding protein n=1 Tax=Lacrimispora defluvii TaxID=2719233 RepID=A0ABX1VMA5_9FIRM|nr:ABC transporter substrate-binding protein [Lacrimispora defluvii]NNJ29519.1 ABC transporter substrate-binding protein [Lacrimispora defluvii]
MFKFRNKGVFLLAFTIGILASGCTVQTKETAQEAVVETRVINTAQGETEIPANPQRVIVTYCLGDALALGVKPVATYDVKGTAYEKELEGIPVWEKFEAEQLIAYEPDLFIVVNQEQYDIASKIAPTILLPFREQSMEERVRFMGDILNKQEEAALALKEFNKKLESTRAALAGKNILEKTFSIIEGGGNSGIWVYGDKYGRGGDLLYNSLGFHAPEIVEKEIIAGEQYREVSMEVIGDYIGDYIIIAWGLNELDGNRIWESLPAVKKGNVISVDFNLFFYNDIYSSNVQLDYLMNALLKAQE